MASPLSDATPNPPERFTPLLPVDGQELMATWELPPEAWDRTSVKTTRFKPGSQQQELLSSEPISEWNLQDLARSYGPGTYRVQAGPGPYRTKNSTICVSREYADAAGFAAAPPQTVTPGPHELLAQRTFQQATQGAADPLQILAMIQTAVDRALERVQPKDSGLDMIMRGFELATTLTTRSMETAKNMLGVAAAPVETTPRTWAEVALELGPSLLGTFQQLLATPQRQPETQQPPPTRQTLSTHTEPPPMTQQQQPANLPAPDPAAVPLLQIMRQYAPMLLGHLNSPTPPENLAAQLAGLLGEDLDPAIIAAAAQVQAQGPAVLAHAHPEMATPKAAAVLVEWARIITPEQEETSHVQP